MEAMCYIIEETLNKKPGSSVYLVNNKDDKDEKFIVKKYNKDLLTKEETERLQKEMKILVKLKCSNIIRYYQYKQSPGHVSVLMEYANNGTLEDFLENRRENNVRMKTDNIIDIFTQLCIGMKYLHDRKIVHRNLIPSVIFLTSQNIVKIGGLESFKPLENTDSLISSLILPEEDNLDYIAPEIQRGEKYTAKSDIWSLGCLLYEMCSLKKVNLLNCDLTRAPKIGSSFPKELSDLVEAMVNSNPEKRPSINEILNKDIIRLKVEQILGSTLAEYEFQHSVFHGMQAGDGKNTQQNLLERSDSIPIKNRKGDEIVIAGKSLRCSKAHDGKEFSYISQFIKNVHGEEKYLFLLETARKISTGAMIDFDSNNLNYSEKCTLDLLLQTLQ